MPQPDLRPPEHRAVVGDNGTELFPGVRRVRFEDDGYDPGCGECGARPGYRCTCGDEPEPYCDECGADTHYACSCYEYA